MIAFVTGHSRGLGAAIAATLLERKIRVTGISRGDNPELAEHYGSLLLQVRVDLSDIAATAKWLKSGDMARHSTGHHSAFLVNNAGLLKPIGPLETQDTSGVMAAVAVNVGAALALSAEFARVVQTRERRILHISSGAARNAYAGWSVYCATKAALDHHARAVALDRTPNLRICSLAPGVIDTDMQTEIRGTDEKRFPDRQRFVELKQENRLKSPETAARQVVDYLLGDSFGANVIDELPRA